MLMQDGLDLSAVRAKPLSKLAMCLKPRYHFAALHQTFYEKISYRYVHPCIFRIFRIEFCCVVSVCSECYFISI